MSPLKALFALFCACLSILAAAGPAFAVRPFITDDARVAAPGEGQIESSVRLDDERFQNLNVLSFGIAKNLECALNFIDGAMRLDDTRGTPSVAGPGLQVKYLFTDGKKSSFPATGIVAGAAAPWGLGSETFANPAWSSYGYFVLTKYFFPDYERLNLHVNLGLNQSYAQGGLKSSLSWGVGIQAHVAGRLYLCTEVFQGDPYAITPGALYQVGLRYFISDRMQADLATGKGIYGEPMLGRYVGLGLRYCFDVMKKR